MIEQLPGMAPPAWLMNLNADTIANHPFPLKDVLTDSLYYPGAGTDGKPVRWLAGNCYSFVYTDYLVEQSDLMAVISHESTGLRGYEVLGIRNIAMQELIPNGWNPVFPDSSDGNPPRREQDFAKPFCLWLILERQPDYDAEHGPKRFSLLYLCGDGVGSYQALYNSNRIKPKILFLIQHGFGGNWTNFENPNGILARSVAANPAGMPDWLIGRHNKKHESYWPELYPGPFLRYLDGGHGFAVWPLRQCA